MALVSSNGIHDSSRAWLIGVPVDDEDPQDLLAVPAGEHGWLNAAHVMRLYRGWLRERVGQLDDETTDQLDAKLRAAMDP